MNSEDKKEIVNLMDEDLEQVVIPRFQKIEDDIVDIKTDIKDIKGTLDIHTSQLEGINRRLDNEADKRGEMESTVRNHEKRLTKVEAKVV